MSEKLSKEEMEKLEKEFESLTDEDFPSEYHYENKSKPKKSNDLESILSETEQTDDESGEKEDEIEKRYRIMIKNKELNESVIFGNKDDENYDARTIFPKSSKHSMLFALNKTVAEETGNTIVKKLLRNLASVKKSEDGKALDYIVSMNQSDKENRSEDEEQDVSRLRKWFGQR